MITTAPLPPLSAVLGWGRPRCRPPEPWLRPGDRGWLLSRTCWSLAIVAELVAARLGRPARVALPAWFCGQSLAPLRHGGAHLQFLPVDEAGDADWTAARDADVAVAVHAFGRRNRLAGARAAAPLVVEDCAHVLMPVPGIGESGDVVLYSPHKLLGLPEGAVLVLRPTGHDLAAGVTARLADAPSSPSPARWRIKRSIQALLPDRARRALPPVGQPDMATDPAEGEVAAFGAPSSLALALLGVADLEREAACRRANSLALRRAIEGLSGLAPLFAEDGPAPYRFALRAATAEAAAATYDRLRRARLPVESWPDLPPEVMAAPDRFGAALALRRTVLLLPVHGALHPSYATRYAEALHGS